MRLVFIFLLCPLVICSCIFKNQKDVEIPLSFSEKKNFRFIKKKKNGTLRFKSSEGNFIDFLPTKHSKLEEAKQKSNENRHLLEQLFTQQATSYKGKISMQQICVDGVLPKIKTDETIDYWKMSIRTLANRRFVTGNCHLNENSYWLGITSVFCKKTKKHFFIKYYIPLSKKENLVFNYMNSTQCL